MGRDFLSLIDLVRNGDEDAINEFVDEYGSTLRRAIRLHMLDSRLRQVVGESDIFQSVISGFLFDLWAGLYDFEDPAQLARLLKKMAESRIIDAARHHNAQRRDIRRNNVSIDNNGQHLLGQNNTPSRIISSKELLDEAMQLFSEQEQRILELRQDRVSWDQIAEELGKSAEAVRKQYARSIERVASQLKIGNAG